MSVDVMSWVSTDTSSTCSNLLGSAVKSREYSRFNWNSKVILHFVIIIPEITFKAFTKCYFWPRNKKGRSPPGSFSISGKSASLRTASIDSNYNTYSPFNYDEKRVVNLFLMGNQVLDNGLSASSYFHRVNYTVSCIRVKSS